MPGAARARTVSDGFTLLIHRSRGPPSSRRKADFGVAQGVPFCRPPNFAHKKGPAFLRDLSAAVLPAVHGFQRLSLRPFFRAAVIRISRIISTECEGIHRAGAIALDAERAAIRERNLHYTVRYGCTLDIRQCYIVEHNLIRRAVRRDDIVAFTLAEVELVYARAANESICNGTSTAPEAA